MNKRAYVKKNPDYWNNLSKKQPQSLALPAQIPSQMSEAESFGDNFYISEGSYTRNTIGSGSSTSKKNNLGGRVQNIDLLSNIRRLSLPFDYKGGCASAKDAIELCRKTYFHFAIYRNTIDLMAELTDGDVYLSGGTDASRNFITNWLKQIELDSLKSQFFREYYRSANVFNYRFFATFTDSEIGSMKKIYASDMFLQSDLSIFPKNTLPIRYTFLNPEDIINYSTLDSSYNYKKVLSPFEIQALRNPQSESDKRIFEALPADVKASLKTTGAREIYLSLDPLRLVSCFYKKQDYEPFGVPFGFPILRDINWKMELKAIDQAISRTLENIILLITAGDEPSKGGVNPKYMDSLKKLFQSEAIGRVLIGDHTTKGQFIVPDIGKILGKEKYEVVNQDIKEGLQNILFEEAKYSNSTIKVQVFAEKLKEGRAVFINKFIQPEIDAVCRHIGFRESPKISFAEQDLLNADSIQQLTIRLMELGILTPETGLDVLRTKKLPEKGDLEAVQSDYIKKRKEGFYTPLVGGAQLVEIENENTNGNIPKPTGRPSSKASKEGVADIIKEFSNFEKEMLSKARASLGIKRLNQEQKDILEEMCKDIIIKFDKDQWESNFIKSISNEIDIDEVPVISEILKLSAENSLELNSAAILYHAAKMEKLV
jgi:hypothetical protein